MLLKSMKAGQPQISDVDAFPAVGDLCIVNEKCYLFLGDFEPDIIAGPRIMRRSYEYGSDADVDVLWENRIIRLCLQFYERGVYVPLTRSSLRFIVLFADGKYTPHTFLNDGCSSYVNKYGSIPHKL